ncbi:MAG: M12 family metallopeptidase [Nocardiaceae bacterium]|nr:M12 family metallopeptidase [Nocardiaceae bacterium]
MSENERHFCVLVDAPLAPDTEAALLQDTKWRTGEEITVRFLEGAPDLKRRVREVAEQWTGEKMANLTLKFVDKGPADIRVAFVKGNGSWSYLGTVCQQIPANQPTMNYGWLTPTSSDDEVRRVVLHEFGHALGLIHEHQNPNRPIKWNRAAVIADLSGPPNNWDPATIENNMFKKYDPSELASTPVDAESIMMYPIPKSWTLDGFSAGMNRALSPTDVELIRAQYPW